MFAYQNDDGIRGTARIFQVRSASGQLVLSEPIYQADWLFNATTVVAFSQPDGTGFLMHDATRGTSEVHLLASDSSTWPESFGTWLHSDVLGVKPPWTLVEIAGQAKW